MLETGDFSSIINEFKENFWKFFQEKGNVYQKSKKNNIEIENLFYLSNM